MAAQDAGEAIHRAARQGDTGGVARMLSEEPGLLSSIWKGDSLLSQAAYAGRLEVVSLLVEKGAQVNTPNAHRTTALHYAAMMGHEEVVANLLASGADTSKCSGEGLTALMYASDCGRMAVVRLLLRYTRGHGLNQRSVLGCTALWYAFSSGHVRIAQALLLAGADHTITINGCSPQDIAKSHKPYHCAAVIQWWEGELERPYVLHKARALHEGSVTRQHRPASPMPPYLVQQEGTPMPSVDVRAMTQDATGAARTKRMREGGDGRAARYGKVEVQEDEISAMVGYVVRDLDGPLYTELMEGLRLQ